MVSPLTREGDLLKQSLLKRFWAQLDGAHYERGGPFTLPHGLLSEDSRVVRNEIATVPVALEHRRDFFEDVWVSRAGDPNVPFKTSYQRRMRQVGRSDVGRGEAGSTMKQPRLR